MKIVDPELCIRCKGRGLCGRPFCPILEKRKRILEVQSRVSKNIEGFCYNIFVGREGYPYVSAGPMVGFEKAPQSPPEWLNLGLSVLDIARLRLSLVRGKSRVKVDSSSIGLENEMLEVAGSSKEVYEFVEFERIPSYNVKFFPDYYPMGLSGDVRRIELLDTPRIPRIVEKLYYDEIKAEDCIKILYNKGFYIEKIAEMLSAGFFGIRKKIVPTRWSITAVDSTVCRYLLSKVISLPDASHWYVFEGELFGNTIIALGIPTGVAFEYIECYKPDALWNIGRKNVFLRDVRYSIKDVREPNTGGAYYAAQLAFLEYMIRVKRKMSILVVRMVGKEYTFPLGVWVVREAARRAVKNVMIFDKQKDALKYFLSKVPAEIKRISLLLRQRFLSLWT